MDSTFINGLKIFSFSSRKELIDFVSHEKKILIAINAEKILNATNQMRELINNNIGYCDGIGAVWALKRKGLKNTVKIPGCELWLDIIKWNYNNKSFYLVGSKQEVIEKTESKLKKEFSEINIVNFRNGYLINDTEKQALINDIRAKKSDIVFVAMGTPKQELLMQEMQEKHQAIYQGLGGSFDVYVGNVSRAPKWWMKNNLEWAYRLFSQPRRIFRQYVFAEFLIKLVFNKL